MNGLLVGLLVGIIFLVCGGALLFSKRALDWMFKKEGGGWRIGDPANEENEKRWRRIYTGGGLFVMGIILTVWMIVAFFIYR